MLAYFSLLNKGLAGQGGVRTLNLSNWEEEAGRSPRVQNQPGLQEELQANQGHITSLKCTQTKRDRKSIFLAMVVTPIILALKRQK